MSVIIKTTTEQAQQLKKPLEENFNDSIWLWIAIAEVVIIVFLLIKLYKKRSTNDLADINKTAIRKAQKVDVDMDNVINSINGSRKLYKELSRKCHPDLFIDSPKQIIAEDIFQEITRHQRNFEKLSALKVRAINELNINL